MMEKRTSRMIYNSKLGPYTESWWKWPNNVLIDSVGYAMFKLLCLQTSLAFMLTQRTLVCLSISSHLSIKN